MNEEEQLREWVRRFPPATECAVLPWFEEAQMMEMLRTGRERELVELWQERERRIRRALHDGDPEFDPLHYGFELPHWADADADLRQAGKGQYVAGGKRATKTERAAKRLVKASLSLPNAIIWAFQGDVQTSRATQQRLVWKYLPPELKALNSKSRHGFTKINYSIDGGFTEETFVLPNRTQVFFLTYNQKPKEYQGWEIGARLTPELKHLIRVTPDLFNLGAWMDEDCPLDWLETVRLRCTTRDACWMWTFSTMNGITAAIKAILGTPETVKSRKAVLLPTNRKIVDDCPAGEMPVMQRPRTEGVSVCYFHTDMNPFPPNYENMRAMAEGKPEVWICENLYGWSRDTRGRAWPRFSAVHLVDPEDLPERGTNYRFMDPAGARNFALLWVRVTDDKPSKFYVYRDWPDEQTYGPWAVEQSGENANPDGVWGPATRNLGFGVVGYKRLIWRVERIKGVAGEDAGHGTRDACGTRKDRDARRERDPYRRRIQEDLKEGETGSEEIWASFIDPRAGKQATMAERTGGTSLIDRFFEKQLDKGEEVPGIEFLPAPGLDVEDGIEQVQQLLEWDNTQDLVPILNEPRLYVSRQCRQVIWALEHYTGMGGDKGGCKDWADLLRYMATSGLRHVEPRKLVSKTWGY